MRSFGSKEWRLHLQNSKSFSTTSVSVSIIIAVLYLCSLHPVLGSGAPPAPPKELPPTSCIICDSQSDPICREDDDGIQKPMLNPNDTKKTGKSMPKPPPSPPTSAGESNTTNATVTHLNQFMRTCPPRKQFCYKAEGKVVTVNVTGHPRIIWKVDRGCAKAYYGARLCARVIEEDESDFRICYCNGTQYCNRNFKVFGSSTKVRNPNGAERTTLPLTFVLLMVSFNFCFSSQILKL